MKISHILGPLIKNIREIMDDDKADRGEVILQGETFLKRKQDKISSYPCTNIGKSWMSGVK